MYAINIKQRDGEGRINWGAVIEAGNNMDFQGKDYVIRLKYFHSATTQLSKFSKFRSSFCQALSTI